MSAKQKHDSHEPVEILMPMDELDERPASADDHNPRTSPAMRDGNDSHGSPSETAVDELNTDNDVGDVEVAGIPYGGKSGGAVGGTPAGKRARGGSR